PCRFDPGSGYKLPAMREAFFMNIMNCGVVAKVVYNFNNHSYMIRRILFVLAVILPLPMLAAKPYAELPSRLAGSMMPYDFSGAEIQPIWPDSLKPVYVAHVARHGARYISSAKKLEKLQGAISKAAAEGTLTKEGRRFDALLKGVLAATGNQWGLLSQVGAEEERRLASDLYHLLPGLLRNARANAISTYVPRVVMTMYEFNHSLTVESSGISISASEGRGFSPLLRCFTADSAYAAYRDNGDWRKVSEHLTDSIVSPEPAHRILGKSSGFSEKHLKKLTLEMYDVLQSLTAFGLPAPTDEFMSEADYRACWEVDNLEHYLRNTITPLSDLAGEASAPLLARILSDADASLGARMEANARRRAGMTQSAEEGYDANFYFGHAETLMPLLSLMRLPGCYSDSSDFFTLYDRWRDYDVVPLGANLDIILLESPRGNSYVTLRLNGRFVAPMNGALIVSWSEYRVYLNELMMRVTAK
ncbi:MAG: histidine phosphatase family protein, partial [Muribaculaceae bacterium]|nr:histidine phosphatase family protein [Muribaculaceae bacterium]